MKRLAVVVTGVCSLGFAAYADSSPLHPTLGKKSPETILNKDIMELPKNERSAWIHGAVSQMGLVYAGIDQEVSRCITDWAFDIGDGLEVLPSFMDNYPERPAYATIYAVAKQACPDL